MSDMCCFSRLQVLGSSRSSVLCSCCPVFLLLSLFWFFFVVVVLPHHGTCFLCRVGWVMCVEWNWWIDTGCSSFVFTSHFSTYSCLCHTMTCDPLSLCAPTIECIAHGIMLARPALSDDLTWRKWRGIHCLWNRLGEKKDFHIRVKFIMNVNSSSAIFTECKGVEVLSDVGELVRIAE